MINILIQKSKIHVVLCCCTPIKFHPRHFFCFFFFEMNSSLTANAARVAHWEIWSCIRCSPLSSTSSWSIRNDPKIFFPFSFFFSFLVIGYSQRYFPFLKKNAFLTTHIFPRVVFSRRVNHTHYVFSVPTLLFRRRGEKIHMRKRSGYLLKKRKRFQRVKKNVRVEIAIGTLLVVEKRWWRSPSTLLEQVAPFLCGVSWHRRHSRCVLLFLLVCVETVGRHFSYKSCQMQKHVERPMSL